MSIKCIYCNDFLRVADGIKYLSEKDIPKDWQATKARVFKYSCLICEVILYQLRYFTNDNKDHPQKHITEEVSFWNLGQWEKPTKNEVRPNKAAHCYWTDDVSQTTGDIYERVITRENRFLTIYRDRNGKHLTWKGMAATNRKRLARDES